MDLGLRNKVVMVSGASRGLGFAVARALAAEGACLSIASRDETAVSDAVDRLSREWGAQVIGTAADVREESALSLWHEKTLERFHGVDALFTNSGGPPPGQTLSFDDASWRTAFDLLVMSVARLARLVVPSMVDRKGGAILVCTSSSIKEPIPGLVLSNALRASVGGMAKTLSTELGPYNIRVNNILPGRISTERMRQVDEFHSTRLGVSVDEARARSTSEIPLNRYGTPDEFGRVAAFLLSDAASYLTGVSLQVDGGLVRYVF